MLGRSAGASDSVKDGTPTMRRARDAGRVEAAETELRETILRKFFAGSPAATESDFERLYSQLRGAHLLDVARQAPEREHDALRATGQYRM